MLPNQLEAIVSVIAIAHLGAVERMADYKVPSRVVLGQGPLPRNANGKIRKAQLRELAKSLAPAGRSSGVQS